MSTMTPRRPHFMATGVPNPLHRGWLTTDHVADVRQSLEQLIETFESNRIYTAAAHGAILGAAYDAGIQSAVHEALADLENGRYGDCVMCEAPIDVERLRHVPYARRCTLCQRVEEHRWNQIERMVASVVRAQVGEPQGRSVNPSPDECHHRLSSAQKAGR